MANLRNRDPDNLDGSINEENHLHPDVYQEPQKEVYRDGYVHGRVVERRLQEDELEVRDNNNAGRGLLLGIILASLLGLGLAALYYWNQRQEQVPTQILVPDNSTPSVPPAASQEQNKTTIIERERAVPQVIPVPQQPASAPQQSAPRVNINVPQQPAAPQQDIRVITPPQQPARSQPNTTVNVAPQAPTRSNSSNSTTQTAPSDLNSDTAPSGTENSTDTPSGANSDAGGTTNSNP